MRRRRLGSELRELREETGASLEHGAETLECGRSRISRIEVLPIDSFLPDKYPTHMARRPGPGV
ncbi:helix-turn-helix domain-containing protein [Streptomyces sp. NBC_01478]|uniref:helix-turn-helix domain-containing protein n=1 Tax=Streptomyces sp. NBC_01478 TaxID=2903882 RepID=UPI002E34F5F4|nr:helix-turn-helix transcriptional regulator [Streptomyces sp. NBC_01478]